MAETKIHIGDCVEFVKVTLRPVERGHVCCQYVEARVEVKECNGKIHTHSLEIQFPRFPPDN